MPRKIICTVPERVCSREQILPAEKNLARAYREHFGAGEKLAILWCGLPEGQSYVAGSADDVFIVMFEVEDGLDPSLREAAMMDITKCFSDSFGIPIEKPLVSALASTKVDEYLKGNRNRLRWQKRLGFLVGTLWQAVRSKKRDGFSSIRANL